MFGIVEFTLDPFVYKTSSISPMHHKSKQRRQNAWDDSVAPSVYLSTGAHIAFDMATPIEPVMVMEAVGQINDDVEEPVRRIARNMGRYILYTYSCNLTAP